MKTESAPKQSAVSAFLGEAASSPEATVRVEITGTPPKVQSAIAKLARRGGPAKRPGGAPPKPEGGSADDSGDAPPIAPRKAPRGDEDDPDVKERAAGVVESLIQEEPEAGKSKA